MLGNLIKRWYLCCRKHRCHKCQCMFKYLLPQEHLSFEREFDNRFNNLTNAIKLPRRQIKDSRNSEAATESHTGTLSFLSKSLKILVKEFIFGNAGGYKPAVLLTLSQAFLKVFPIDCVCKVIEQLF